MNKSKLTLFSVVQMAAILLISVALIFLLYDTVSLIHNITNRGQQKTQDYTHHIAVIGEYEDLEKVKTICKGAEKESFPKNAVIENLVPKTGAENTGLQDLVDYATAMNVDGIIAYVSDPHAKIKPPVTFNGQHVPLVLLGNNIEESTALSFIGTNAYDLGVKISKSLQMLLPAGGEILIIYNNEKMQDLFLRIMTGVKENSFVAQNCTVNLLDMHSLNDSSVEDKIREIIHTDESLKSIVCLSFNDTVQVAETIVDLNLAGKIKIIGLGDTEKTRSYLQKGIISALVSLQYDQMGKQAIDSIFEYMATGYTSGYTVVGVQVYMETDDAVF